MPRAFEWRFGVRVLESETRSLFASQAIAAVNLCKNYGRHGKYCGLEEISKGIDLGENPIATRLALADKITECLKARRALLSPPERVSFGHAIDLLPST